MPSKLIMACFLFLAMFSVKQAQTKPKETNHETALVGARVTLKNEAEQRRFLALNLDVLEMRENDDLFILTTREELAWLQRMGWNAHEDAAQTRNALMAPATFRDGYRTVVEIRQLCESRAAQFPQLAEVFNYGQSWERVNRGPGFGHDLFGIRLTNRTRLGPKPTLFLMAAIHARELATTELAARLIDYLTTNYGTDGDVRWLLDEHQVVIVPVVNPDGRVIAESGFSQRKNTNNTNGVNCFNPPSGSNQFGVDLNRNHSWRWGTVNPPLENPCGQTFPGPTEESEPETIALQNLIRSLFADQRGPGDTDPAPLDATGILISLHSFGNLAMWPWGYTNAGPPNGADLAFIGSKMGSYATLTPQQWVQLYPASGITDDWSYGELGIASFTFEIGPASGVVCGGFFPAFSCLDGNTNGNFWGRTLPAFLYAARLARAPYLLGRGPAPETATTNSLPGNQMEIRAQLSDTNNGNQNITAAEYYVDTPPWAGGTGQPMNALDGTFDSPTETATATLALTENHLIYMRGRDATGNWGPVRGVFTRPNEACAYNATPSAQNFSGAGGAGSVTLNATLGCAWTAAANADWLTLNSGLSGSGNATINFTVAANPGATRSGTLTIAGQTITINQAAVMPSVQWSATSYAATESAGLVTVSVTRAGDITAPLTVDYATQENFAFNDCGAAGTLADQRCDYAPARGALNFAAGETVKSFAVLLVDDLYVEGDETLNLVLSNPSGGILGANSIAALIITDNDATAGANRAFVARLDAAQEAPANNSTATGNGTALLNNAENQITVNLAFGRLSSAQTAAHIHGGAPVGQNAPVLFNLGTGAITNVTFAVTPAQVAQLKAGIFYFNVHSADFPNGEIRGQIVSQPLENARFFVRQQYADFLSREPDTAGFDFWTGQIAATCGADLACTRQRRVDVSNAFFFELEFQQTGSYVYRLYRAAYGATQPFPNPESATLPNYTVFVNDRARVVGGASLAAAQLALANAFTARAEFLARYPAGQTAAQFVDAIVGNIQAATGANLTSQRDALISLHNASGRGAVVYRLADDNAATNPINNRAFIDAEYNRAFVITQYYGYLRRDADFAGFNFWLGVVNQFPLRSPTGQNGMVCAFITSQEYQERFSAGVTRANQECP